MPMHDPSRQAGQGLTVAAMALAVAAAGWWAVTVALPVTAQAAAAEAVPAAWEAPELVRLHVIAATDRPSDQQAKLRAARAVVSEMGRLLRTAPPRARRDADSFLGYVMAQRRAIEAAAAGAAGTGPVRLETGRFFFPLTVDPQGHLYPAGWYRGVRVVLGQGRGRNWWCVVFPSLCPAPRPDQEQSARAAPPAGPVHGSARPEASPPHDAQAVPGEDSARAPAAAPPPARPQPWWVRLLPWLRRY